VSPEFVTHPRSIPWVEAEDDFLYELHRERGGELMAEDPEADPQSFLPLSVPQSRQREWAKRFNEEFEITTREGSDIPRPNRSFGDINTCRLRIQRIIERRQT
jgi:hypothetical protein